MSRSRKKCSKCGHLLKYHTPYGCIGAFPNGTKGMTPEEVFYGECLCQELPARKKEGKMNLGNHIIEDGEGNKYIDDD